MHNTIKNQNQITSFYDAVYSDTYNPVIVLSLARSFDKHQLVDGSFHLVCCAYKLSTGYNIDSNLLAANLKKYYSVNLEKDKKCNIDNRNFLLFRIRAPINHDNYSYKERELDYTSISKNCVKKINDYLLEVTLPLEVFLSGWSVSSRLIVDVTGKDNLEVDFNDKLN